MQFGRKKVDSWLGIGLDGVRLKNAVESDGFSGRLGRLQSLFPGSVLPE
jgi:hypothetical protein